MLQIHGGLQGAYRVNWGASAVFFVTTDASPRGMGGVLEDASGHVACWFDGLGPENLSRFRGAQGDP
eukprot:15460461-Alexandrium_andersonii.AAC.1